MAVAEEKLMGVLFSLETISFVEQKLFSFIKSHLQALYAHMNNKRKMKKKKKTIGITEIWL
jgi:hypothetical protein